MNTKNNTSRLQSFFIGSSIDVFHTEVHCKDLEAAKHLAHIKYVDNPLIRLSVCKKSGNDLYPVAIKNSCESFWGSVDLC